MHQLTAVAMYSLDLLGIFGFALSGAFLAVRKDFSFIGAVVAAEAVGLGGGLVRDLVLDVKPIAFTDPGYPLPPVAAALLAYLSRSNEREPYVFELLDALGLGLFSVTGALKALEHGMGIFPSAALGVGTAIGGGVIASVIAGELPYSMRWDSDLYAVPAITGALTTSVLHTAGALDAFTGTATVLAVIAFRLFAVHFHWRLPRSRCRRRGTAPIPPLPPSNLLRDDTLQLRMVVPPPLARTARKPVGQRPGTRLPHNGRHRRMSHFQDH